MRTSLFSAVGLFFSASSALGALVSLSPPSVTVGPIDDPNVVWPTFESNGNGTYSSAGEVDWGDYYFDWNMTVDPDPFISASFTVVNNTALPQTFVIGVLLPIIPQVPLTVHGGSVGLSLTDANFNGAASVTDAGVAVYQGTIDGVAVLDLLDAPFLLATGIPGFTVTASDFDGLPGPTLPSGPALLNIGITHTFTLSAGDRVAFTSFFVVNAIPEAGTLTLCGVGLAGLIGMSVRRRRIGH